MKIAVASDNWINVDRPLEKDGQFIIFRISEGKVEIDSVRKMSWEVDEIFSVLADCSAILCCHTEHQARERAEKNGIKVIETHGPITEIINDYLKYFILQNIIEKRKKNNEKTYDKSMSMQAMKPSKV